MNTQTLPLTLRWQVRHACIALRLVLDNLTGFDRDDYVRVPEGLASPPSPRAVRMMRAARAGAA